MKHEHEQGQEGCTQGKWGYRRSSLCEGGFVITEPSPDAVSAAVKAKDYPITVRLIASLQSSAYIGEQEQEANAAFIVRACNSHDGLLAALTGMLNKFVRLVESGDAGNWDAETEPEVITARAAIAAAKGGA